MEQPTGRNLIAPPSQCLVEDDSGVPTEYPLLYHLATQEIHNTFLCLLDLKYASFLRVDIACVYYYPLQVLQFQGTYAQQAD